MCGGCSGQNSNGSQFFILYKSAPHLDYKHTVFGKVVGGLETLTKMERVPVDAEDRPKQVPAPSAAPRSVHAAHRLGEAVVNLFNYSALGNMPPRC